ncbi:hypothetical protein EG68_02681 [Paragonimus skrjabini miyazakii]|uniref:Uncharacterized protein n=1 Tax=Paragonimus skrjabini miyazakii TaxID=59628 RepID=A0A8S9ZA53_9TREM|nr:hypothetical protein EG68_02681 [Paragonimus skrjabini miyazakii]
MLPAGIRSIHSLVDWQSAKNRLPDLRNTATNEDDRKPIQRHWALGSGKRVYVGDRLHNEKKFVSVHKLNARRFLLIVLHSRRAQPRNTDKISLDAELLIVVCPVAQSADLTYFALHYSIAH